MQNSAPAITQTDPSIRIRQGVREPRRLARTAGFYYLVVAVLGAFAHIVRGQVFVPGDAATTARNGGRLR